MLSSLALAALFATAPTPTTEGTTKPKPPKPTPEERLAQLDDKRIALNMGVRGYSRFLGAGEGPAAHPSYGGGVELGLGVRLVRGLYLHTEVDAGAHALPVGAAGRLFVGARHELRMTKWIRPELSLGYSLAFEGTFDGYADCGCKSEPWDLDLDFGVGAEAEFASRNGVEAGLGFRVPFKRAPRLSLYVRGDATYYFDDRPGRLQAGGSMGFSIVF